MNESQIIIKKKRWFNISFLIFGLIIISVGFFQLVKAFYNNFESPMIWMVGLLLLSIGFTCSFLILDSLYLIIHQNKIVIKSLFRHRVINREDIVKYGVEKYVVEENKGQRIKIFTKKGNYQFDTYQYSSLKEIKKHLKGLTKIKDPFNKRVGKVVVVVLCLILMVCTRFYDEKSRSIEKTSDLEFVWIPVKSGVDFEIIREEGDQFVLKIDKYKDYIFKVAKTKTPREINEKDNEFLIMIDLDIFSQTLYKIDNQEPVINTSKIIQVIEITNYD